MKRFMTALACLAVVWLTTIGVMLYGRTHPNDVFVGLLFGIGQGVMMLVFAVIISELRE